MTGPDPPATSYVSCPTCGDAVGRSWTKCPSCDEQFPNGVPANFPKGRFGWRRLVPGLRIAIVVGVILALAIAIIQPTLSGPPIIADPLTTSGSYTIPPGGSAIIAGAITGEDYIEGNYSVMVPYGTGIEMDVYNSTEYGMLVNNSEASPAASVPASMSGRIVFAAPYTDNFYFVFTNPYPTTSNLVETVYIVTNYESNVVIG